MKLKFNRVGGHPLVDFVNTKVVMQGQPLELLKTYTDFLIWLQEATWTEEANNAPCLGNQVLIPIQKFRRCMRDLLQELIETKTCTEQSLATVNTYLKNRQGSLQVKHETPQFLQHFVYKLETPEQVLGCLAHMAAHFLEHTNLQRLKKCEHEACIRYFIDTSRNGSRRWCAMESCGNRMKARAHYARQTKDKPS